MKNIYRKNLCKLIHQHPNKLYTFPGRCEALLRDYCGSTSMELNLLVAAMKSGIPEEISTLDNGNKLQYICHYLPQRLVQNYGLSKRRARWAVESWAIALDITTVKDIKSFYKNGNKTGRRNPSDKVLSCQVDGIEFIRIPQGRAKIGNIKSLSNNNSVPILELEEFYISKYVVNQNRWIIFRNNNFLLFKKNNPYVGQSSWSCLQSFINYIKSLYIKIRFISQFI